MTTIIPFVANQFYRNILGVNYKDNFKTQILSESSWSVQFLMDDVFVGTFAELSFNSVGLSARSLE